MPDDLKFAQMAADLAERENVWYAERNLTPPPAPARPAPVLPLRSTLPMWIHVCGLQGPAPSVGLAQYGDEVLLTLLTVEQHLTDRHGNVALLHLLDDDAAQIERFGRVIVRVGRWPTGHDGKPLPKIVPGSPEWKTARSDAYQQARSGGYEVDRKAALKAVAEAYGPEHASIASPETFAGTYGLEGLSGRMA